MDSNFQDRLQPLKPTGAATATECASSDGGQTVTDQVRNVAHAVREQVEDRGAEIIDRAKLKASQVYDQANKNATEQYKKAIDYGRENPGKTTLIVFGVGVGLGALLVSSFTSSRSGRG